MSIFLGDLTQKMYEKQYAATDYSAVNKKVLV